MLSMTFEVVSMVHNCLHHKAPRSTWWTTAFQSPMWPVNDIFVLSRVITSLCLDTLSSYGRRAFAVASPTAWNSLSDDLRDPTFSTDSFCLLKTRLFSQY